eukprot:4960234-Prymnesium_polylepis.1
MLRAPCRCAPRAEREVPRSVQVPWKGASAHELVIESAAGYGGGGAGVICKVGGFPAMPRERNSERTEQG